MHSRRQTIKSGPTIKIGVLYSLTGTYGVMGYEMLNGVLLAVDEINGDGGFPFTLQPVIMDPSGKLSLYYEQCETLVGQFGVKHVVGCYTSASRKQVLPIIERDNALLWHSARYEGFECSDNVVYVGAAPNQHIVPLAEYALQHYEPKIYCVGSNYIWTWETNRVLREIVTAAGGEILAERLVPLGDLEVEHLVHDIVERRPAAIFNTLVGESSYRFYKAVREAAETHPHLHPRETPMLSCSLCEPELHMIGPKAAAGHIASSVYFQSIAREKNASFLARYRRRFGSRSMPSVDTEAAYLCTMLLARALRRAETENVDEVKHALYQDRFEAPQGPVWIDSDNNHCFLTPRLARSRSNSTFEILWEAPSPVKPDPYLVWLDLEKVTAQSAGPVAAAGGPRLRVVK